MADDTILTLTHATERDIDLLLIEELQCSPAFVKWLVQRVSDNDFERSSVTHSKRRIHNRREIDITLSIDGPFGRSVILIENKLDTSEQPQQAESYREEAQLLVSTGAATAVHTVLVCPHDYAKKSKHFATKFDHVITYEDITQFLAGRASSSTGELQARLLHRVALLTQATTKARRGYEAVALVDIDRFSEKYVAMLKAESIALEPGSAMLSNGRPGESRTMIFAPNALPKWAFLPQTRLVHQLREANANINLYGWGDYFTQIAGTMAADLKGTNYRLVPTVNKRVGGRSGIMIVAATPLVDSLAGFDEQRDAVLQGAKITECLRDWFAMNEGIVRNWATLVTEATQPR